jgi:hypothetical protein
VCPSTSIRLVGFPAAYPYGSCVARPICTVWLAVEDSNWSGVRFSPRKELNADSNRL